MSSARDFSLSNREASRRGLALDLVAAGATGIAALCAYWQATGYYFSQDDFTFLARIAGIQSSPGLLDPFGTRVISTRLYFQLMHHFFGLHPVPYHWASLVLHSINAVLVYAVARCWTGRTLPALVAGLLFATFDLAFTAVFWTSGIQDLLATTFLLCAALIWVARAEKGWPAAALSASALALSMLSKESGLLFPGVLLLLAWAQGNWRRRDLLKLAPHTVLALAALALVALQSSKVAEAGAYGAGITLNLFHNLATYIAWTADVVHPFKDRVATIDYGAWKPALAAVGVLIVFLATSRGRQARTQWAAAAWYALAVAPVLPLLRHTYLYYLYPASPGAAMLGGLAALRLTSALERARGPRGRALGWGLSVAATAAICAIGFQNVRARENILLPPDYKLPYDHVLRSSVFAQNAASSFAATAVPEGADLLLINPFASTSVDLTEGGAGEGQRASYDMVRTALREGLVLRLLRPDVHRIDFARPMEPRWEEAHAFLYDAFGRLTYLGTRADTWANLSTIHLRDTKRLGDSIRCSRRALELYPDHPRASLNLGIALARTGAAEEAREHLRRAAEIAPTPTMRETALRWLSSVDSGP